MHIALARRGGDTRHRAEHFGPIGRGRVRVKALEAMLDLLKGELGDSE